MGDRSIPPSVFHAFYAGGGRPPYDIDEPQPDLAALADRVRGSVLDVGCGTGEHALFYATRGHEAWGVDMVAAAIDTARSKSAARGLQASFVVGDALSLETLGRTFDYVVDSGLFHVFSDADRARYVQSLARVLRAGGTIHLMCFSEHVPVDVGPRRVTQAEIRGAFADGWIVREITEAAFVTNIPGRRPSAWRAVIERTA
jgi:ubiquinone/menaquinone biosynthesis C-methylase UbiE